MSLFRSSSALSVSQLRGLSSARRNSSSTTLTLPTALPTTSVEVFTTLNCGLGLRSLRELKTGVFVDEILGEVMREQTYLKRHTAVESSRKKRKEVIDEDTPALSPHRYGFQFVDGYVLDASKKGAITRFINHSCEPNCELRRL